MWEHENCMDNVQMRQTDESWRMMSQMSCTKTIAQINCTTESHGIGLCFDQEWKSQMMLSDAPELLRCLWRHLRLLI